MKKICFAILGAMILGSCDSNIDTFTITGEITGDIADSTQVILRNRNAFNRWEGVDTTIVKNGTFSFKGTQAVPRLHHISLGTNPVNALFILENGEINIKFQKDSINHATIKGTLQNELFSAYKDKVKNLNIRGRSVQQDMLAASQESDSTAWISLQEELVELQTEGKNMQENFLKENPNSLIAALIIEESMNRKAISEAKAEELYEALTPKIKETEPGKRLELHFTNLKNIRIGRVAPNFSAPTPEGDTLSLAEAKGKITLIDFWAGWCRPCRIENPNIVSVYNKYHDKGFNVIGVSLDTKAEVWKNAIEEDGLEWSHVSNLNRFHDSIARMYNINAIPASFLLDEEGKIISKNLRGSALEEKVAELLK